VSETVSLARSSLVTGVALVLVAGGLAGYLVKPSGPPAGDHLAALKSQSMDEQREALVSIGDDLKTDLAKKGEYDCCLVNPCNECLYDEGSCECRADIVAGEHPCGECIGEILAGNGMPELKPYFAQAIAHKVGTKHEGHLQEIIDDMYPEV